MKAPPHYAMKQLGAKKRQIEPESTGLSGRDLDHLLSFRPDNSVCSMRQKWRRHEQTCGRVSVFAIRTDVMACLSEVRAALMGFHSTAVAGFIWMFPFALGINEEILTEQMQS